MLNSCRLHWVPSTFSMMNICQEERWKQSIRQQIFGTTLVPSLETHQLVLSQLQPCIITQAHPWSATAPGCPQILPALLCLFHGHLLQLFPSLGEERLFLRRCLCFSWSREGAGSRFPLLPWLPWKASAGQDLSSSPATPSSSHQPCALQGSQLSLVIKPQ